MNEKENTIVRMDEVASLNNNLLAEINSLNLLLGTANSEINYLREQVKLLRHHRFSKRSEKIHTGQMELVFEPHDEEEEIEADDAQQETITYTRKKAKPGRKIDTSKLPRTRVIHDLSDTEKSCSCCKNKMVCIGEDVSEKIEYQPSVLEVIEHVRPKYACRECQTVTSAKKDNQLIPKSMAGNSLLTEVILMKYHFHIPLYRQSQILKQNQIYIPANTLGNWVLQVGEALAPVEAAMRQQFSLIKALQVDETPVKNKDKDKKSFMWCYHSLDPGNHFVLYEYNDSRGAHVPNEMLTNFKGVLQTDGYAGYNALRHKDDVHGVGCMAHVRRKFIDVIKIAGSKKMGKANTAVAMIKKLYEIETQARDQVLTHQERYQLRQKKAVPILKRIKIWLDKSINQVPQKSAIGRAIGYALRQWPYVSAYADHAQIEIDNNLAENLIRPLALGRKNWLFVGNERGAKAAAIIYSLIQSCIINDINAREYFNAIMAKIPAIRRGDIDATTLLPQFFQKN